MFPVLSATRVLARSFRKGRQAVARLSARTLPPRRAHSTTQRSEADLARSHLHSRRLEQIRLHPPVCAPSRALSRHARALARSCTTVGTLTRLQLLQELGRSSSDGAHRADSRPTERRGVPTPIALAQPRVSTTAPAVRP